MTRRLAFLGTAATAVAAVLVAYAFAGVPGVKASLKVTSAEKTGVCGPAGQAYDVHGIVTVDNGNSGPVTVTGAEWSATGKSVSKGDFTAAAQTSAGGPTGSTVAAHSKSTYRTDVTTVVPCDATSAQLCVNLTILSGTTSNTTGAKCDKFVESGKTVVPAGTVGLLGLTAVLGAALLLLQALTKRRPRRAPLR